MKMKINVVTFARIKEVVGTDHIELQVDNGTTVAQLKAELLARYPGIGDLLPHCTVAVDHEYSDDQTKLRDNCEVGLIPPVSGG